MRPVTPRHTRTTSTGEMLLAQVCLDAVASTRQAVNAGPVWSVPPLCGDEVARPGLAGALVSAVRAPDGGAVGVTTGLVGGGRVREVDACLIWKVLKRCRAAVLVASAVGGSDRAA